MSGPKDGQYYIQMARGEPYTFIGGAKSLKGGSLEPIVLVDPDDFQHVDDLWEVKRSTNGRYTLGVYRDCQPGIRTSKTSQKGKLVVSDKRTRTPFEWHLVPVAGKSGIYTITVPESDPDADPLGWTVVQIDRDGDITRVTLGPVNMAQPWANQQWSFILNDGHRSSM